MIVNLDMLKQQLRLEHTDDDMILARQSAAAQDHVERLLGFKIEATYGGVGQDAIPPSLVQAVQLLAAHWYGNREAVLIDVVGQGLPYGVWEIVREYRQYSFDG